MWRNCDLYIKISTLLWTWYLKNEIESKDNHKNIWLFSSTSRENKINSPFQFLLKPKKTKTKLKVVFFKRQKKSQQHFFNMTEKKSKYIVPPHPLQNYNKNWDPWKKQQFYIIYSSIDLVFKIPPHSTLWESAFSVVSFFTHSSRYLNENERGGKSSSFKIADYLCLGAF